MVYYQWISVPLDYSSVFLWTDFNLLWCGPCGRILQRNLCQCRAGVQVSSGTLRVNDVGGDFTELSDTCISVQWCDMINVILYTGLFLPFYICKWFCFILNLPKQSHIIGKYFKTSEFAHWQRGLKGQKLNGSKFFPEYRRIILFIFVGLGTCWVTDKLSTRSATEGWPLTTGRRRRRRKTADGRDSKQ